MLLWIIVAVLAQEPLGYKLDAYETVKPYEPIATLGDRSYETLKPYEPIAPRGDRSYETLKPYEPIATRGARSYETRKPYEPIATRRPANVEPLDRRTRKPLDSRTRKPLDSRTRKPLDSRTRKPIQTRPSQANYVDITTRQPKSFEPATLKPKYDTRHYQAVDITRSPVAPKTDFPQKIREEVLTAAPTELYMPTAETKPVEYIPTDAAMQTAAAEEEITTAPFDATYYDIKGSVAPLSSDTMDNTYEPYHWDATYTMDNTYEPYHWDATYTMDNTYEPSYDWDATYTMDNTYEPSHDWDATYPSDYTYTYQPEEWDTTYPSDYTYTYKPEEWDTTYDTMNMYHPSPAAAIHDVNGHWVGGTYYPNDMAHMPLMPHMPPHDGYYPHVDPMMHYPHPHEIMHGAHMPHAHQHQYYMEGPAQDGSDYKPEEYHYPSHDAQMTQHDDSYMNNAGYEHDYKPEDYSYHYPSDEAQMTQHDDSYMNNAGYEHDYKTYADDEPHHYYPNEPEYDMHTDGYEHADYEDITYPDEAGYDGAYDGQHDSYEHDGEHHKEDDMPECLNDCVFIDVDFEDENSMCEWWMIEGPKYNVESCFNDCSPGVLHVVSEEMEQMCSEEPIAEEDREDPLECVMDCPIDDLDPHSAESFCPWFEQERKNGCFNDCSDEFLNMAQEHAEFICAEWKDNQFTNFYIDEPMSNAVAEENRDSHSLCPAGFIKKEDRCEVCPAATFSIAATFECIPCPSELTSYPGSISEEDCFKRETAESYDEASYQYEDPSYESEEHSDIYQDSYNNEASSAGGEQ